MPPPRTEAEWYVRGIHLLQEGLGHRRRSRGTSPPPEFGAGGLSPPDFVMLQNFKHQITCITM